VTIATKGKKAIEKKVRALERLTVEYLPASDITPNMYNPNVQDPHEFYLLVKSMLEDGFTQPIIVLREDKRIVDGEHRWTGAIVSEHIRRADIDPDAKGAEAAIIDLRQDRATLLAAMPDLTIPVVLVDMSPEQARIATLRHNRARGTEDVELTAALLRDLEKLGAIDWAQDSLLMDDAELQRMLEDIPVPTALGGEEFGEAWEPTAQGEKGNEHQAESYSLAAIEERRRAEREAATASSEEDRVRMLRERDNFRFGFVYVGDEARTVKTILGDQPAVFLLRVCRLIESGRLILPEDDE
jgi:ParB-like chromosome segregation protein Spo0J